MASTITEVTELQKAQLDAWQAVGQAVFNATEKLLNLNLTAAKVAFQDATESSQALLGARDVQEFLALAGSASQPTIEKVVGYTRNAYGIASGTGAELTKIVEAQLNEGNRKLADYIDVAAKSAPAGSESAVSLFKSAFAAANTAFDTASKATRQATDWAESNFASAASATLNAAAAANESAKSGKARKAA
jgi:phasin family protein